MFKFVTLIAFMVMGVIIIWLWRSPKPEQGTVTRIDTARQVPVVINNWPATSTQSGSHAPVINVNGMDSAQLRAMMIELLRSFDSLHMVHTAVNNYDTTFQDSTYKESIRMQITHNRLSRFTRNMEVYNRTTTITKPARFALLGGGFGYSDGLHTAAGFQLSGQTVRGDLYSVGYDLLNKGWYGSMQFKIRLRK